MKTIINEALEMKPKYPYIGVTKNGCVVLFIREGTGTCIAVGETNNHIGQYIGYWGEDAFRPLQGSIVLSND
jgi:hypothetical protein